MPKYNSVALSNKWIKTKWLWDDEEIKPFIPPTLLFNKKNVTRILDKYSVVYFKPVRGSCGADIYRIEQPSAGEYTLQKDSNKMTYVSEDDLYEDLKKRSKGKKFLLQKGIDMADTNGDPFDLRVMVQKTNEGQWVTTAVFTKIGKAGKVVNNYHQGGRLSTFKETMEGAGFTDVEIEDMQSKLERLGEDVGNCFDRHLSGFRELGLDVAIDKKGRMWILEVNTKPQYYPLKHFKDKSMYERIISIAKQYGRE
jgi:glutathione synthase/RimK-type ligase-like ATP-grasp enzyme